MRMELYERRTKYTVTGVSRRAGSIRAFRRHDVRVSRCSEVACTPPPTRLPQEVGRQADSPRAETQGRDSEVRELKWLVVRVASEFGVRQPLADDLRNRQVEALGIVHVFPIVIAECLFIDVAVKVKGLDTNVGTLDGSFQKTPKILDSISMNLPVDVGFRMVDDLMPKVRIQGVIRKQFISVNGRSRFNVLGYQRMQFLLAARLYDLCANFPATFQNGGNNRLSEVIRIARLLALSRVHVASLGTDKGFIGLNFPRERSSVLALQSQTRPLQHEPRRLLSDANMTVNLPRANTVLAVGNQPHNRQSLIEPDRRVFEYRPSLQAELTLGVMAGTLPTPCRRVVG